MKYYMVFDGNHHLLAIKRLIADHEKGTVTLNEGQLRMLKEIQCAIYKEEVDPLKCIEYASRV